VSEEVSCSGFAAQLEEKVEEAIALTVDVLKQIERRGK